MKSQALSCKQKRPYRLNRYGLFCFNKNESLDSIMGPIYRPSQTPIDDRK
jgi:hypothetical protein